MLTDFQQGQLDIARNLNNIIIMLTDVCAAKKATTAREGNENVGYLQALVDIQLYNHSIVEKLKREAGIE
jgi:hypothetical protein